MGATEKNVPVRQLLVQRDGLEPGTLVFQAPGLMPVLSKGRQCKGHCRAVERETKRAWILAVCCPLASPLQAGALKMKRK